jgi:ubiquinone biosynthesis protein COQ4
MSEAPIKSRKRRRQPLKAWRAMQSLLEDGERTGEVFKIVEALEGGAMAKSTERLRLRSGGAGLLAAKPEILDLLQDREALRGYPEGSLGRAYLHFVESEDLSADGLMEASMEADRDRNYSEDERWFGNRLRDTHDLFHVVTGYGRDGLGEISLLAFSVRQTPNLGIKFVIFMSQRASRKDKSPIPSKACIKEARDNADRAEWLGAQEWETLMPLPLEEVRSRLNVEPPEFYEETKRLFPDQTAHEHDAVRDAAA